MEWFTKEMLEAVVSLFVIIHWHNQYIMLKKEHNIIIGVLEVIWFTRFLYLIYN